jgi:predicted NAD/FAD-binding protein
LRNLSTITAQKRNLLKPGFWRMLYDLVKFVRTAEQTATDPDMSLGEFLDRGNFGEWFRRYYLLPISGAIWSSTPEQISDFPARSLVQFFRNHALLQKQGHQWYTVDGGSREYVTRIVRAIQGNGGTILTNAPVQTVRRDPTGVSLKVNGGWQEFDQVVFACHSDQALALLESPTADEKRLLGAVKYQPNTAVLHRDERMMPKRKSVWAAWVFRTEDMNPTPKIGVTYWMNALQNIDESEPLFVSLNCRDSIPEDMIYDVAEFAHPVFDRAAIRAQEELPIIQGQNNSWFCGAWTRWGFHEDGYASGMNVAQQIMSIPARELAAE